MGENKNAREFGANGTNQNKQGIRGRNPVLKKLLGRFYFSLASYARKTKRETYIYVFLASYASFV